MGRKLPGVLLTAAMLRRAGACYAYLRMFRKKWPKGVRVTPELCDKMAGTRVFKERAGWAAEHLLTDIGHNAYIETTQPVRALYNDNKISLAALNAARASAFGKLYTIAFYRRVL